MLINIKSTDIANKMSAYGGAYVILIHPDVLGPKLAFEKGFVAAMQDKAWFGALADFGAWWRARDAMVIDVMQHHDGRTLHLSAPLPINGLTLHMPPTWQLKALQPPSQGVTWQQHNDILEFTSQMANADVTLAIVSPP